MIEAFKSVRKERAAIEHDRLILESMMEDEIVNDTIDTLIPSHMMEDTDISDADIEALIDKIPESDDTDEQIDTILKSKKNLSIDDVMGISDGSEDDDLDDDEDDE